MFRVDLVPLPQNQVQVSLEYLSPHDEITETETLMQTSISLLVFCYFGSSQSLFGRNGPYTLESLDS